MQLRINVRCRSHYASLACVQLSCMLPLPAPLLACTDGCMQRDRRQRAHFEGHKPQTGWIMVGSGQTNNFKHYPPYLSQCGCVASAGICCRLSMAVSPTESSSKLSGGSAVLYCRCLHTARCNAAQHSPGHDCVREVSLAVPDIVHDDTRTGANAVCW